MIEKDSKEFFKQLTIIIQCKEKVLNNFKSRLFAIKSFTKIATREPTPDVATEPTPGVATEPTKTKRSKN